MSGQHLGRRLWSYVRPRCSYCKSASVHKFSCYLNGESMVGKPVRRGE